MVARNALASDGGEASPGFEGVSELTLWKRNLKREVAQRRGVPKSRIRVEARRERGEIVLEATVI